MLKRKHPLERLHNQINFHFGKPREYTYILLKDFMVLQCTRFDRFLSSRASSFRCLLFRSHTYSSAASTKSPVVHAEQANPRTNTQIPNTTVYPPSRSKVEEYLQLVETDNVTLDDLESLRPQSHSPMGSEQYEDEYEALVAKLDRSFTVKQLQDFIRGYGLHISKKSRKRTAATTIIEKQWGWPSLAKSQKLARSKREVASSVFELNPQEAFLLLGKDGSEILTLSRMHNVRLQFTKNPLSMTITGTSASVDKLDSHVHSIKQEIVWEVFDPPMKSKLPSSLQELSRLSNCFLEPMPGGKIRIWYRESSQNSVTLAKKLLMQHAIEDVRVPLAISPLNIEMTQLVQERQDSAPTYAFYPYFFGKWFGGETRVFSHISNDGPTHNFVAQFGDYADAREQLLTQAGPSNPGEVTSVTATFGHVVVGSQDSSVFSLAPPLEGQKNIGELMDWMRARNPSTEFIQNAPIRDWQAPKSDQPWKRRLVYESIPDSMGQTHSLICEYTPGNPKDVVAGDEGEPINDQVSPAPVLRGGLVVRADVLMPDDSRDLRLALVRDSEIAISAWPHKLSELIENITISPAPDAPLVLEHEGKQYILKEDTLVQSNVLSIGSENLPVNITSERRSKHQSSESYLSYEISCPDLSDAAWKVFWGRCEKVVQDGSAPPPNEIYDQGS
ncbi:hypothetical protein NP233_g4528 [Leucocoprinus birnbaumii]|uniref:SLS1 N-terminal domain-containing protein n=1 Tax=Leucocoprinus birnbaumii TaxID=56174 RepID=A0AAD5VX08_9AGAR|nr:hypothetical protein NP233_g4528 [Leucocoprinus birnbaumii]